MGLTVHVKATDGKKITLDLENLAMKVSEFKELLHERLGIPAAEQRLILSGAILRDENTLSSYHMKDGAVIAMVRAVSQAQSQSQSNTASSPAPPPPTMGADELYGEGEDDDDMEMDDDNAHENIMQMLEAFQNPDEILERIAQEYPDMAATPQFQEVAAGLRTGDPSYIQRLMDMLQEVVGEEPAHVFTEDELRSALSTVMTGLGIQPGPPQAAITAEMFSTYFVNAYNNMQVRYRDLQQYMQDGPDDMDQDEDEEGDGGDTEMADHEERPKPAHTFVTADYLKECLRHAMERLEDE
eukprot:comp44325_c0_seq1/m.47510 comp44325_c0_seq1/g.47510  ORF comp44325_c0_seq1/g.47510 comp44325_c0_seq1/m.47510 type:complete len:298 (-) comp44325_c0_seq1:498-1391(-)